MAAGQLTAEVGLAQLSGFAGTIAVPEHLITDGVTFLRAGGGLTADDLAAAEMPTADSAQAPPAPAQPAPAPSPLVDRAALRREIERHEKNMRAEPGSPEWRSYWKDGGAEAYRAALGRLQASMDDMAGLAGDGPAPAQPAPAVPASAPAALAATQAGAPTSPPTLPSALV